MKMRYATSIQENKRSFRTTIPSALINFLELNTNKKAVWILEVDNKGNPKVTVEFKDKSKE